MGRGCLTPFTELSLTTSVRGGSWAFLSSGHHGYPSRTSLMGGQETEGFLIRGHNPVGVVSVCISDSGASIKGITQPVVSTHKLLWSLKHQSGHHSSRGCSRPTWLGPHQSRASPAHPRRDSHILDFGAEIGTSDKRDHVLSCLRAVDPGRGGRTVTSH